LRDIGRTKMKGTSELSKTNKTRKKKTGKLFYLGADNGSCKERDRTRRARRLAKVNLLKKNAGAHKSYHRSVKEEGVTAPQSGSKHNLTIAKNRVVKATTKASLFLLGFSEKERRQ